MFIFSMHSEKMIKRESGENPEQSRCCMFHSSVVNTYFMPLKGFKSIGKAFTYGNESEDLPCNTFNSFRGQAMDSIICTRVMCHRNDYSYIIGTL